MQAELNKNFPVFQYKSVHEIGFCIPFPKVCLFRKDDKTSNKFAFSK